MKAKVEVEETPGMVWRYEEVLGIDESDGREWIREFIVWVDDQGLLHFEVGERKDGYRGERYELSFKEFLNELAGVRE